MVDFSFRTVTIIGNCLMPLLALFLVWTLNALQQLCRDLTKSDEED
jgi:hypothetical protein